MTGRILTRAIPAAAYSGLSRGRGILQVGFSPLDLDPGLFVWENEGVTANETDEVLGWKDQSTNALDFTPSSASARPSFNKPDPNLSTVNSLTFDTTDDELIGPDALNPGTGDYSFWVWFRTDNAGYTTISKWDVDAGAGFRTRSNSGHLRVQFSDGTNSVEAQGGLDLRDDKLHSARVEWNASTSTLSLWVDGVLVNEKTDTSVGSVTTTAPLAFSRKAVFGDSFTLGGEMYAAIVLERLPTDDESEDVSGWSDDRYGVAA